MKLALIRHGITEWNLQKRIQGQIDQSLSEVGREEFSQRKIPVQLAQVDWYCSPLRRARQTAEILAIRDIIIEPRLMEMSWGDWEGEVLKPLRKQLGATMRDNEARGIDFCPPNGESPRQVQARIKSWLADISGKGRNSAAVVHKGIIRNVYAMAFEWDMRAEAPINFDWGQIHLFEIGAKGELQRDYRTIAYAAKNTED